MKINKKLLQLLAAVMILAFHLFINVSGTRAEMFILKIGYIGVDLFFFVSAYSLADKKFGRSYTQFIRNRFGTIFIKFAFFCILAAIYGGWKLDRLAKTVFFVDFFERGGGSFLWFVPAIMIFYLLFPLFVQSRFKYKTIVLLVAWFVVSLVLDKAVGYTKVFIFTNRIPVILAGYLYRRLEITLSKHENDTVGVLKASAAKKAVLGLILLTAGLVLVYFFGFESKLAGAFAELFYVVCIPMVVGLAILSSLVPENKLVSVLASASLELYALQMIFGSTLSIKLFKWTGSRLGTNLLTLVIGFLVSVTLEAVFRRLSRLSELSGGRVH